MKINAWIGFGLAAIAGALTLAACDDYEFALEECTEDWACRTNFGVGYTCTDDGYCIEPQQSELNPDDELTAYCDDRSLNFPPDIFQSSSARRSITLGVITDFAGRQMAYAARLAMGLADIRATLPLDRSSELAGYKFTLASCVLSDSQARDDSVVREVARFLRNDVRAEAILLGLGEEGTDSAIGEITNADSSAGESGHTLVISANDGFYLINDRMNDNEQVWTMAASERSLLERVGEQLVLRRLQPYAVEACKDDDQQEAGDGICANKDITSVEELLFGIDEDCEDEDCDHIEVGAYNRYLEENSKADLAKFVVRGLIPDFVTTGQVRQITHEASLRRGIRNVLEFLEEHNGSDGGGESVTIDIDYEIMYLDPCGVNCGRRQMQVKLLESMGCEEADPTGDGDVVLGCDRELKNETDAILLLSDEANLVDATYDALIGVPVVNVEQNEVQEDLAARTIFERAGVSGDDEVSAADTLFIMSAAASSASTGQYATNWMPRGAPENETDEERVRRELEIPRKLEQRERWFEYIRNGRIFGVRQSADPSTEPFQSFLAAQEILVDQDTGTSQHYIAQAYDAVWLAMAAISGSIASMEEKTPSASEAEAMRNMRLPNALTHSKALRKHFSGETRFNLIDDNVDGAVDLNPERQVLNFIPTQWSNILRLGVGSSEDDEAELGHFLNYSHLLRAASGELRFADSEEDRNYDGRERMSFDYGIWMPTIQDKVVENQGESVDLAARQCIVGMIPPKGVTKATNDGGGDELRFVCPVEATVCSQTYKEEGDSESDDGTPNFCVPMNAVQKMPYAFPMPEALLLDPELNP